MKNKEKYDLRKLQFHWLYNSYHDRCGVSVVSGEEYITDITGEGYSPIPAIMNWLEREENENRSSY